MKVNETAWVTNVGEGTTKGTYRGIIVEVKEVEKGWMDIYLDGEIMGSVEERSPVKAINVAKEAIDRRLTISSVI